MKDNDSRLQRLHDLTVIEVRLSSERRKAMRQFLDAVSGFDHDEPFSPQVEMLHAEVRRISIAHGIALASATSELDTRAAELGDELADETAHVLRELCS